MASEIRISEIPLDVKDMMRETHKLNFVIANDEILWVLFSGFSSETLAKDYLLSVN